jgi:hypothetical protein
MNYMILSYTIVIFIIIIVLSIVIWLIRKFSKNNEDAFRDAYREYVQKFVAGVAGGFALYTATKMAESSSLNIWDYVLLGLILAFGFFLIFTIGLLITTRLRQK